jgi:hypothetical protein
MPMYFSRVYRHLRTLGILWCVLGVYRVVSGLIGMMFLRAFTTHNFGDDSWMFGRHWHGSPPPMWFGSFWPVIAVATLIGAGLALMAGYSLLNRTPWGRSLAIIAAIFALVRFSLLGGALAIYTLWVLAPGASGLEYDAIVDRT